MLLATDTTAEHVHRSSSNSIRDREGSSPNIVSSDLCVEVSGRAVFSACLAALGIILYKKWGTVNERLDFIIIRKLDSISRNKQRLPFIASRYFSSDMGVGSWLYGTFRTVLRAIGLLSV